MESIGTIYYKILNELKVHGNKEQIDSFKMAYKVSSNDKEMAYGFGLWNKWVEETDWRLGQIVNADMEKMRTYFIDKKLGKFFDLESSIKHRFTLIWFKIVLIVLGVYFIVLGLIRQKIGFNETSFNLKTQQPIIVSGLYTIFVGLLIAILSYSTIRFQINQKKFYNKFANRISK